MTPLTPEERRALVEAPLPTVRIIHSCARPAGNNPLERAGGVASSHLENSGTGPDYFERGTARHVNRSAVEGAFEYSR